MTEEIKQQTEELMDEVVEELQEEMQEEMTSFEETEKDAQIEALTKQYQRLQADFDNFRKRTQSEKEQIGGFVRADLVGDLLGTLDNFDRALGAEVSEEQAAFLEGFKMVHQQLLEALVNHGLEEIKALGEEFDPNIHQAVANAPSEEYEDGIINQVFQKGYLVGGRVVRPAMVVVTQN